MFLNLCVLSLCTAPVVSVAKEGKGELFTYDTKFIAGADTFVISPSRGFGGTLSTIAGQGFNTSTGCLLIVFSPAEQAYYKDGKLWRYQYMVDQKIEQRATPTMSLQISASVGNKAFMKYFDLDMWGNFAENERAAFRKSFFIKDVDGKPFSVEYDSDSKTYFFRVLVDE